MEPKKCPICGKLPRVWFSITDAEGLKRGINEFIVGCRMICAGCGHVDTRRYGTYFIAPDGQIHPAEALVERVTEAYNHEIEKLAEQIRSTAEEVKNSTIDKITPEMEAEPDSVVAMEPEVYTVEIGGQLFRMVQTHPFKPEGGGGGIMYPLGNGGRGTVRLCSNDEVFVEAEQK